MASRPVEKPKTNARGLRVLGVDPALAGATGYGIIEFAGSTPQLIRFGSFKLPARATLAARLYEIHFADFRVWLQSSRPTPWQ